MSKSKVTFIGAGSVVFTLNQLGDILSFPELAESEIALMDIDPERLHIAEIMARKVAESLGAHPTITAYADRKAALEGADYVINTIQVGGYPSTLIDFEVPKRYGLKQTIADTVGIGGIFRALRTIPVSVYIRWKEQDLLALSPLVRLLWGMLLNELTTSFDTKAGEGCQPVLLLIDEAGRTAIPMLADQATTVVGRGISLWIAMQSLSQLETVYGTARAQVLRDNMESQIYYRPADLTTAKYLEDRLGLRSAYAHSATSRDGEEASVGVSE